MKSKGLKLFKVKIKTIKSKELKRLKLMKKKIKIKELKWLKKVIIWVLSILFFMYLS